jgi:homoserine kinase type II
VALDLTPWGLGEPDAVSAPEHGSNNWVRFVRFGAETYVYRLQRNPDPLRVAAEQRLLSELGRCGLSFDVPAALSTTDGATAAETPYGLATLSRQLPGAPPARSLAELELAGRALGELDAALAELPHELAPVDWRRPLATIRPEVTDLGELCRELQRELAGAMTTWFAERLPEIDAAAEELRRTLPAQIVHGDFALGNLLVADGQVTAVLDFEVAGLDLRVADLAAGLYQSTEELDPDQVAAFRAGYGVGTTLSAAEEDALPTLLLHRAIGTVIWRAGAWRAGHASRDDVMERLAAAYRLQG